MMRTLCEITSSFGSGTGGWMAYLPLSVESTRQAPIRDWLRPRLEALINKPKVFSAHLMEGDQEARSHRSH